MNRLFKSLCHSIIIMIVFPGLFLITSCTPKYFSPSHFEKMKWIEGQWSSTEQGITITEKWKYTEGTGFNGASYITVSRDTLFSEQILIRTGPKRSIVFESASGQFNVEVTEPISLKILKKNSFTFQSESKNKTISYRNKKNTVLQIEIREDDGNETSATKYLLNKIQ